MLSLFQSVVFHKVKSGASFEQNKLYKISCYKWNSPLMLADKAPNKYKGALFLNSYSTLSSHIAKWAYQINTSYSIT